MLGARHVEVQLTQQGTLDRLNQVSINVLHATRTPNSVVVASWVTDDAGATLMFQGSAARGRRCDASKPIRTPQFKGHFHIAVSTREVFVGTLYVAGGFFILGLAAYYGFRRLPLAGLDEAQQLLDAKQSELLSQKYQLETQNLRFDAALNNMSQGLCMFDARAQAGRLQRSLRAHVRPAARAWPSRARPLPTIMQHRLAKGLHAEQFARRIHARPAGDHRRTQAGDQDPRAQRRAHHRHQASADARRGLALRRTRTSPSIGASRRASRTWRTTTS